MNNPRSLSLAHQPPAPSNASMYTLNTIDDDHAPLLTPATPDYGAAFPRSPRPSSTRVIFHATLKMAGLFVVSTLFLGGTLWLALPTLEEYVVSSLC